MPKWQQSLNSFVLKVLQSSLPPEIPTYSIQSDTNPGGNHDFHSRSPSPFKDFTTETICSCAPLRHPLGCYASGSSFFVLALLGALFLYSLPGFHQ